MVKFGFQHYQEFLNTMKSNITPTEIEPNIENVVSNLLFQGWAGVAIWMSFGLLHEGLLGFRAPAYLQDSVRRELFQLAHTHGTVLSLVLLFAAFTLKNNLVAANNLAILALRIGSIFSPSCPLPIKTILPDSNDSILYSKAKPERPQNN